jgi:bifunctional polynucleotide phosphatase/kinase
MEWKLVEKTLLIGTYQQKQHLEGVIAGFDLDGTIIKPKYNKKRFTDKDKKTDWEFFSGDVKSKLQSLHHNKYKIIFVTNQMGKIDIEIWKHRIENVLQKINLPITIYCALADDGFRKPRTNIMNKYINYDKEKSFYCGDAGGRIGDFADTDRKFAINLGINFYTPDNFFDGHEERDYIIKYPAFPDRITLPNKYIDVVLQLQPYLNKKLMVLLVGFPSCGKSHFANRYLFNFQIINQDKLKTLNNCLKLTKQSIEKKKNLVIDNTNLTLETRKTWIDLAKQNKYKVVVIWFQTPFELCLHNNYLRNFTSSVPSIKKIVYYTMRKRFVEPTLEEGCDTIITTNFYFDANEGLNDSEIYYRYYY